MRSHVQICKLSQVVGSAMLTLGFSAAPIFAGSGGLQFDGVNDYVTFGQAPGLGTATFTLECWFKRTGTGASLSTGSGGVTAIPLVTKGRGEADGSNVDMNWFLGIRSSDNVLTADFEEGATGSTPGLNHPVAGVTPIVNNQWYHAAVTYNGTKWQLFLDGAFEAICDARRALGRGAVAGPRAGSYMGDAIHGEPAQLPVYERSVPLHQTQRSGIVAEGGIADVGSGLRGPEGLRETGGDQRPTHEEEDDTRSDVRR